MSVLLAAYRKLLGNSIIGVIVGFVFVVINGQNKELSYTIYEEGLVPAIVGNIARDSNVSQLIGSDVLASLKYRLLRQPDADTRLFAISETTGRLTTAGRIDRERLCHYASTCRLQAYVAIQQTAGAYFVTVKVNVNVEDINDNSPHFPRDAEDVPVTENAGRQSIDIVPAMDADIGKNTIQRYELVSGESRLFALTATPTLDGTLLPSLVIKKALDREHVDGYLLKVLAKDGGSPIRTGTLTLNITVEDVNDNSPVFTTNQYNVSVNETLSKNSFVIKVIATDCDIGFNGKVLYRFSSRQTDDYAIIFSIHEATGEIYTVSDLNKLQGYALRLIVEAVDQGSKPLKTQAIVNIKVMDVVNNRPAIRLTTISEGNVYHVAESAPTGYVVAHFIVDDRDSGSNGIVSCSVNGGKLALQKLAEKEYKVTLVATLNREQEQRFNVNVRCWDLGRPNSLMTSASFVVIVEDVNDNSPVFRKSTYRRKVSEEQGPGALLQVYAVDADVGENARVFYYLGNRSSFITSLISVEKNSGEVSAKTSFDREVCRLLDFIVVAIDGGVPQHTATARVLIEVTDINDRKPSLPVGYTLKVMENQARGATVGVIQAIDEDEGENGRVSYHLLSDNNATQFFSLENSSGLLTNKISFDRETKSLYHLSVLANDKGKPPQTNILDVTVEITDENDNPPVFVRPRVISPPVNVSTSTSPHSVIFLAKAIDADVDENAKLDFAFLSDDYTMFAINGSTGAVSITRKLKRSDVGMYRLVLLARDRGDLGSKTAIVSLDIRLEAANVTGDDFRGFGSPLIESHLIIIIVLVLLTLFTAVCVTVILIRFRQDSRHHEKICKDSKQSHKTRDVTVLDCDVKLHHRNEVGINIIEDNKIGTVPGTCVRSTGGSRDKTKWKKYEAVNGYGVEETGEICQLRRDGCDDVQGKQLQTVDHHIVSWKTSPSRRPLVSSQTEGTYSDVITCGSDDINDKAIKRLVALKVQQTMLLKALESEESKMKVVSNLEKQTHTEEKISVSSKELNGADSGRGESEEGSQVLDVLHTDSEAGFSSFLALPTKDGWRHVPDQQYLTSPTGHPARRKSQTRNVHDGDGSSNFYGNLVKPDYNQCHGGRCVCSCDIDCHKNKANIRCYENTPNSFSDFKAVRTDQESARRSDGNDNRNALSRSTTQPRRPGRTVHFSNEVDNANQPRALCSNLNVRQSASCSTSYSDRGSFSHREPAHVVSEYVNMGCRLGSITSTSHVSSGCCVRVNPSTDHKQTLGAGCSARHVDDMTDSVDTREDGNTTTTSGSYTVDHDARGRDSLSDVVV